jgi:hypothetical protein
MLGLHGRRCGIRSIRRHRDCQRPRRGSPYDDAVRNLFAHSKRDAGNAAANDADIEYGRRAGPREKPWDDAPAEDFVGGNKSWRDYGQNHYFANESPVAKTFEVGAALTSAVRANRALSSALKMRIVKLEEKSRSCF